jgi:hypothetical protein
MKPRGFNKKRHTFSRKRDSYVEYFQVQGSSWNTTGRDEWAFYLNAGVRFLELPEPTENRGFPGTHVYGRLSSFHPATLDAFELREDCLGEVMALVAEGVDSTSIAIASHLGQLRESADAGRPMVGRLHHSDVE